METVPHRRKGPVYSAYLTHWGRVTHICVSNLTIIGSDNGLLPGRHQAIIWTNAEILWIGLIGTNVSETAIEILTVSFKKMYLKWRPFCLSLNVFIPSATMVLTWLACNIPVSIPEGEILYGTKSPIAKETLQNMCNSVISIVPADGLALLGARPSAGTVMTKFGSCMYKGPSLEMLKQMLVYLWEGYMHKCMRFHSSCT